MYSRCAKVGHAEVDPSVGFGHMVPSGAFLADEDGQVRRNLET